MENMLVAVKLAGIKEAEGFAYFIAFSKHRSST